MYNRVHNVNTPEEIDLELLRQLESEPRLNQRGLAARLGLSLGKANYCLNALVRKGLIAAEDARTRTVHAEELEGLLRTAGS